MAEQRDEERNIIERFLHPSRRGRIWQIFIGILLLVIGAGLVDAGKHYNRAVESVASSTDSVINLPRAKEFSFNLGLDLQGGTHLIYEADVSDVPEERQESALAGVRDVIERRVNALGVNEPDIRTTRDREGNYRITAGLAGIRDVETAIERIGETPLLEFKEEAESRELTKEEKQEIEEHNRQAQEGAEEVLGKLFAGGKFSSLAEEYGEDNIVDPSWIDAGERPELSEELRDRESNGVVEDIVETGDGYSVVNFLEKRIRTDNNGEPISEINASHLLICYEQAEGCDSGLSREEAYEKAKELKEEANPDNFNRLAREHSAEPNAEMNAGDLGWFIKGEMVEPFEQAVFEQEAGTISYVVETKFGYHLIYKKEERPAEEYKIQEMFFPKKNKEDAAAAEGGWNNTRLSGKHLNGASVSFTQTGEPQISLQFNNDGAELFKEITERNVGKRVGIFLDGEAISSPTVNEAIPEGEAVISGQFTLEEAKELAQRLNAGALPVPIDLISQKTVGPSLGQQSIDSSLKAGIIGLILVALFLIAVYRLVGLLATLSLFVYGILLLAIFKLFSITLTLGSLAGFVVSIGMAVDANVLIFERLREELRKGGTLRKVVSKAFQRAWPSIRDGNISTLITCFILMQFTTGVVRGFAITLFAGILVSMFTAIIVTRNFMDLLPEGWAEKYKKILIRN